MRNGRRRNMSTSRVPIIFRQIVANRAAAVISSRPAQLLKPHPWWRKGAVGAAAVRDNPRDYRSLKTRPRLGRGRTSLQYWNAAGIQWLCCDNLGTSVRDDKFGDSMRPILDQHSRAYSTSHWLVSLTVATRQILSCDASSLNILADSILFVCDTAYVLFLSVDILIYCSFCISAFFRSLGMSQPPVSSFQCLISFLSPAVIYQMLLGDQ